MQESVGCDASQSATFVRGGSLLPLTKVADWEGMAKRSEPDPLDTHSSDTLGEVAVRPVDGLAQATQTVAATGG